jgi:23S rRNA (guanine745-N1)-methyltransferase
MASGAIPDGGDTCAQTLPFVCPICGYPLSVAGQQAVCEQGHTFDLAREGYVNLLVSGRRSRRNRGDSMEMVRARQRFMMRGHYDRMIDVLASRITDHLSGSRPADPIVLDVGCGEGYITIRSMESVSRLLPGRSQRWAGIDISRPAIQHAARRAHGRMWFAVANLSRVPVADGSVEVLLSVFAHVNVGQVRRLMSRRGVLVVVGPGARHLYGIRSVLYSSPTLHDERVGTGLLPGLRRIDRQHIRYETTLEQADIKDALHMTPYVWNAPQESVGKLEHLPSLVTPVEFYVDSFVSDELM